MFCGEFRYQLDNKNRLRIPAKLRSELGDTFHIMKSNNGCLYAFSKTYMEDLVEKTSSVPITDRGANLSLTLLFSATTEAENDEQGRFVLPVGFKNFANIDKNTVIIGVGNRLEIWAEDKWEELSRNSNFETALDQLSKYGI